VGIATARWMILWAAACAAGCAVEGQPGKGGGSDGASNPVVPELDAATSGPSDAVRSAQPPPDVAPVDSTQPIVDAASRPAIDGSAPAAPDAGAADAAPTNGARVSLRDALAARWTGERKSITPEDGTLVFTGVFEPGRIGGPSGHTAKLPISPGRDYLFEYRVRFDTGFDWSRGGKLPGLAGATAPTGCVDVTGTGFTARMMWHDNGRLTGYTYALDQNTGCGNSIETGVNFTIGRWYRIKERVKLNTGSSSNGVLQIWVDDRMVVDRSNIPWMNEAPDRRIDLAYIQTFFGGSTLNWAPSRQCSISFSDLFVTKLAD
jgi:hypothetical protein